MTEDNVYAPGPVTTRKLTAEEIAEHEKRMKNRRSKKANADLVSYVISAKLRIKKRSR